GKIPVFDLIFLGIGKDGHTASLFPGHGALNEQERLVVTVKGGDPDVNRLTMTFPVLNRARQLVFLVSGKEKAEVVKAVLHSRETGLPAERIQPVNGRLTWLLDRDGASLISAGSK
ncbi:MAG: 6-phosphogluconolactonase, partial [Desulfobacteraceae bacterium]